MKKFYSLPIFLERFLGEDNPGGCSLEIFSFLSFTTLLYRMLERVLESPIMILFQVFLPFSYSIPNWEWEKEETSRQLLGPPNRYKRKWRPEPKGEHRSWWSAYRISQSPNRKLGQETKILMRYTRRRWSSRVFCFCLDGKNDWDWGIEHGNGSKRLAKLGLDYSSRSTLCQVFAISFGWLDPVWMEFSHPEHVAKEMVDIECTLIECRKC